MFDRCIDCLTYDLSQIETLEKVLTVSAKIMVILVHTIRDRNYIGRFGFYQYIGIGLNRSWQNAVIFHTHPDNSRKKAQRSKSKQLSYNNAIRCGFINKQTRLTMEHASAVAAETNASTGGFAMLEATMSKCCVRINSRCTSGSFRSMKSLTST